MSRYVIRSTDETDDETGAALYWRNDTGWSDRDTADVFAPDERDALTLPIGGVWEKS